MKRNTLLILFVVLALSSVSWVQAQPKVTNLEAYPSGKSIALTYDLSEQADVSIYVSTDGGKQFRKIKSEYLTGEFGKRVDAGEHRKVLWHVLDENNNKDFQCVAEFEARAMPCFNPFVLATGSYGFSSSNPQNNLSGGLMVGAVSAVGFYVRGETSFSALKDCAYIAQADGTVDGKLPFYSGKQSTTSWQVTGGLMVRMMIPLYLYVGGGYGQRELYWEMIDGQWTKNLGGTYTGFTGDIGLMANIKHCAIVAGVSSIGFKYTTIRLGIGYMF